MHQVYELNARAWQIERTHALGRPATLDDISYAVLDHLVESGFTWLYLFGVWRSGPLGLEVTLRDEGLVRHAHSLLPDFTTADLCASPVAIASYEVATELGGDDALERLRDRARASGLSLMLDFIPNHVGLDHPWAYEHPDFLIQGNDADLARDPGSWIKLHGRVFAYGRDPFFAPWRDTLQIDYANLAAQNAVIREASRIAARCDGLRCEEAMLLLPDVFQNTWGRSMPVFWRRCLDAVRAEHPGTLFLAEVYWNREWELQQAGFDFTYDKTLYDRLLTDDAESIRAHLRAAMDYQCHSVRFLENDDEQRAAARFASIDHHRGALFLTGMVPGVLLCHHGQEDGRRIHCPHRLLRRPPEEGSEFHRSAYRELLQLLSEPARHDGRWQLLEPRDDAGRPLIACLWSLAGYHSLLLIVNASWHNADGAIDAGPLAQHDCQVQDFLAGGPTSTWTSDDLSRHGVRVALPPWGARVFRLMALR